jgi:23S rRNA (adenine-N6)-dimethyltransferase
MSARGRTVRDWRRRRLGQNFLNAATADFLIDRADFQPRELVVEVGAGRGAMTAALARRGVRIIAVEPDPVWSAQLRERISKDLHVRVIEGDFLSLALPLEPFRVVGSLPFARTTDMLRRLLDDPDTCMERADVIVQWEVARKRAASPPSTLLSAAWAPWWDIQLGHRIPAREFRPIPRVDAGLLTITRRNPPLLPPSMARSYAHFVRQHWPFDRKT